MNKYEKIGIIYLFSANYMISGWTLPDTRGNMIGFVIMSALFMFGAYCLLKGDKING